MFRKVFVGQCHSCALIQAVPLPSLEDLSRYYSKIYRGEGTVGHNDRKLTVRHQSQVSFLTEHLTCLGIAPQTVLDVGAGHGQLLSQIMKKYNDADFYATEVDEGCFEKLRERGIQTRRVMLDEQETLPFDICFDLITCSHVLEHVRKPKTFLNNIARMLAPTGLVMIEVPNCGMPYAYGGDMPHLSFFTKETLCKAVEMAGMKIFFSMTGGVSSTAYVATPTPARLSYQAVSAWFADSKLPENWMNGLKHAYKWVGQKGGSHSVKAFDQREQELEVLYHNKFFTGQ